jgi:glycosyltransferase involved in cell wall biosynthesis
MSASLSIVIPAYNEVARLGNTLTAVVNYLRESWPDAEVIVVDDGSTDNTASLAREILNDNSSTLNSSTLNSGTLNSSTLNSSTLNSGTLNSGAHNSGAHNRDTQNTSTSNSGGLRTSVITYKSNLGKGRAVRLGLLAARGDVALFSDADLSTPITEAPKLVDPILNGQFDVTFGSRALDRNLIGVHQPWRREQGGRVFNLAVRLATGLPFWDTQCGFKAFRMSVCRPLVEAATVDRFGFDVELLYLAFRAGLRLKEVPVRWNHNEGSTVSLASDSFRMLSEVGLIRQQARRGVYDAAIRAVHEATKK